jgi:membrane protein
MPPTADHDAGHGREASSVSQIPLAGWKDILSRTYREVNEDHILLVAAGVTFYALLALVPFLTMTASVFGLFAEPAGLERHVDLLRGVVPAEGLEILHEQLQRLTAKGSTKLGVTSIIALIVALWTANSGMKAIFEAMNVAYNEEEKRSFLWLTVITLVFTLATIVAILAVVALVGVVPLALGILGLGAVSQWSARVAGIVLLFALMVSGLAALYRWGPSRRPARWRWITPGAALAIVAVLIASSIFGWYLAAYAPYDATYGSLGAIFGFMTWLWLAASIVIVGAELNSEIEHQLRPDTTTGRPRPLGERGALVADTVGDDYG